MKRTLLLLSLCVAIPVGSSWAGVIGSTNPADFTSSTVDWCAQAPDLVCAGGAAGSGPLVSLENWQSTAGDVGFVALEGGPYLYNLVQGTSWIGNFNNGMGLVYNGVDGTGGSNSSPGPILIAFEQAETGVGAYIQSEVLDAPFSASITLFDIDGVALGTYTTSGYAADSPGTALFIGAAGGGADVWFAEFSATGAGDPSTEPNFAIGTMDLETAPEPASLLLLTPALLGLVAFTRRRKG